MVTEILTLYGETDGTTTTGTVPLRSDIIYGTATYITIPLGLKVKIWAKRIAGAAVTFTISFTPDITASPPTWIAIDTQVLPSAGEITLEKRRPVVIRSITGTEAFRVTWSQTTAAKSYIDLEVEVTDEE